MNGPRSLAIIINQVEDDDLSTISNDDVRTLLEGLEQYAGDPDVDAALARLHALAWAGDEDGLAPSAPAARRVLH